MNLPTLLRASLVPIGLAVAMRGIEDLSRKADELRQLVAERQAYLAGLGPLPADDEPADDEPEHPARDASPEDFPSDPAAGDLETGRSSVARPLALAAAGLVAGMLAGRAVARWAHRAELAAAVNAARSSLLESMPPAPGSPADLAAQRDRCGTEPAYGGEPCTLPDGHKGYAHSWEGGSGDEDQAADEPAPLITPESLRAGFIAIGKLCPQCEQPYPGGFGEVQKTLHRVQFCPARPAPLPEV